MPIGPNCLFGLEGRATTRLPAMMNWNGKKVGPAICRIDRHLAGFAEPKPQITASGSVFSRKLNLASKRRRWIGSDRLRSQNLGPIVEERLAQRGEKTERAAQENIARVGKTMEGAGTRRRKDPQQIKMIKGKTKRRKIICILAGPGGYETAEARRENERLRCASSELLLRNYQKNRGEEWQKAAITTRRELRKAIVAEKGAGGDQKRNC